MEPPYVGALPAANQVARFLTHTVLEQWAGVEVREPVWDMYRMGHRTGILHFAERESRISVVGKFFAQKVRLSGTPLGQPEGTRLMQQEFDNLTLLRSAGLAKGRYRVVRPLAINSALDALLVEEYVSGYALGNVLESGLGAIHQAHVLRHVTEVAQFLATLHECVASVQKVEDTRAMAYFTKLLAQLTEQQMLDSRQQQRLYTLQQWWNESGTLEGAAAVWIHGDATPANLLFPSDKEVIAIDLERARLDDPAVDLGCVVAELKHAFLLTTGNPWAGELCIQHFYATYAQARGLSGEAVYYLTRRGQFYMGNYLLRIARNDWLDYHYRRRLVDEAEQCLTL